MDCYKYIILLSFFIFSCEKNDSIVNIDESIHVSLCGGSEFDKKDLSVLSFNRLEGTSLNSLSELIELLHPDIIGLQESYDMGLKIANRFNYCFYGSDNKSVAILSKYPIEIISDTQSKIILNHNLYINFFNIHFTSNPYQPYDIRDMLITTPSQARYQAEQTRGLEATDLASDIVATISTSSMPVIVSGDFNEPSHLDWVAGTENPINFSLGDDVTSQFVVNWPTSNKILNTGLLDAYRTMYNNPVNNPGYTWTPKISIDEVHDRIDMIYYHDTDILNLHTIQLVGPDQYSDIVVDNYESDHRGVFAIFNIDISNLKVCEFCGSSSCCDLIGTESCCCYSN